MDQDSASGGKGSWRDRLGISKDDVGNNAETSQKVVAEPARMAPRAPLAPAPASRPATMAPRAPLPPVRPAPLSPRAETDSAASAATATLPRSTSSAPTSAARAAASDGLAERLRVQREAAERLAEQRLALARQRAAARVQETQANAATTTPATKLAAPSAPAAKPADAAMPVAPVAASMPAKASPAPAAAAPPAAAPRFGFSSEELSRPQRAPAAPAKPVTAVPPLRAAGPAALSAPVAERRAEPRLDGLALRGSMAQTPPAPLPPSVRTSLDSQSASAIANDFKDDFEDGFLESGNAYEEPRPAPVRPPLKIASVKRDVPPAAEDEAFFAADRLASLEKEAEPRKGPILLLGSMLGVIVLFAIGIFIWQQLPSNTVSQPVEAEIPVVTAPVEPIKTVPATEAAADDATAAEAAGKKQIYDRILGEEEQGEQPENVVPSEETPVPQGTGESDLASPDPLPVAEPPADDNSLPIPAEPGASDESGAVDGNNADPFASVLPVPAEAELAAAPAPAPAPVEAAVPAPVEAAAPVEAPAVVALEAPAVETPAVPAPTPAITAPVVEAPVAEVPKPTPVNVVLPRPRPKLKPLASATPIAPALPPAAPATEQVASVDPVAPVATVTAYVAQLQTLNTEADAKAEFSRVRSSHSAIVGSLTPVIIKADLGTKGTIYRMGLGPLASKEAASKLCAQLIAAGEKDCIVRRQ